MASFFATSAVAVGAIVVTTQSGEDPVIRFNSVSLFGDTIYYEAQVSDPDERLVKDSLVIDVRSGLEILSIPLDENNYSGYFPVRYPDMEYRLALKGSQGFGPKTYDTFVVKGESEHHFEEVSGAIYGFNYEVNDNEEFIAHFVAQYFNPNNDYSDFTLQISYVRVRKESGQRETITLPDQLLSEEVNVITLEPLPFDVESFTFTMVATKDGQTDEITSITRNGPVSVFHIQNIRTFSNTMLSFTLQLAGPNDLDYTGDVNLLKDDQIVDSQPIEYNVVPGYTQTFTFENLDEDSEYRFNYTYNYTDPFSGASREFIRSGLTLTTAPHYEFDINHRLTPETIDFTIRLLDENAVLFDFHYMVFQDLGNDNKEYITTEFFEFSPANDPPWKEAWVNYLYSGTNANLIEFYMTLVYNGQNTQIMFYSITI